VIVTFRGTPVGAGAVGFGFGSWAIVPGTGFVIPVPVNLSAIVVAGPQVNLTWSQTSVGDETGYSIERRDVTAGGAFAEIDTVAADVESYTGDAGPFTAKHRYAYRIVVVGGASAGEASNVVGVFGSTSITRRLRRMGY
jgi:hypothetical protein